MNNRPSISLLPPAPDDAAAYWVMRRQSGAMTSSEERDFEAWRAASEENRRALAALENALDELDGHGETLLAEEFERQLNDAAQPVANVSRAPFNRVAASLAAVALLSAAVFSAIKIAGSPAPAEVIAFDTGVGESETVLLADGSQAQLNTASKIAVRYTAVERRIDLIAGEAFFDVDKDLRRPFVVETPNAAITVTGTSFDVFADNSGSSVHVVTGVVDVTPRFGPTSTLLAGDMIEIDNAGNASAVMRFDPSLVLAWRGGKARFRDEPLGDVVASLNRHFASPIVLADGTLAELPVTGEFDVRDRNTAVKALALIFGLEATDEPARTILKAPEQK
jgi:transmembrane sensor